MCLQPQVAGGCIILVNIWFDFIQAAVTFLHRSHESHQVNLARATDWSWYILQTRGYPQLLRGYDVERGNKWWWYQRETWLLCSSQPASSSGSDSTVQSCCKPLFTDMMMIRNTDFIEADLVWVCPWYNRESYWVFQIFNIHYQHFYHYLH